MLLFPAQVKVSRRQGWFRRRTSRPLQPRNRNMATNSNSNIAFSTVGAATLTATVCVYLTSAHARTYTIPLGLAVLVALVGLTTWNLARGGSAALGNFTLKGRKTARRRTPRPAAPPHQPTPPASAGETPVQRHRPPRSRQTTAQEQPPRSFSSSSRGSSHAPSYRLQASPAAGATANPHGKAAVSAGPASVVYAYYAAVNDREWPKAWALAGQPASVDSAAYNQWADGYGCTVRDQVTSITARGAALLVSVRAQESGGVTQTYRFSYVVRGGVLTHPQMLSFTGHAPQGCGK